MNILPAVRPAEEGVDWLLLAVVLVWITAVVGASLSGALGAMAAAFMPAYAALVAAGIAAPVVGYFMVPTVRRAVNALGLRRLTLMHVWRIPAALVFFW